MNNFIPNSFQVPNIIVDEIVAHIPPNALKCYLVNDTFIYIFV